MLLKKNKFKGTLNFSSINSMEGYESSRRDDLISIGYMLIYLIKGELPWSKIKYVQTSERYIKLILKNKSYFLYSLKSIIINTSIFMC